MVQRTGTADTSKWHVNYGDASAASSTDDEAMLTDDQYPLINQALDGSDTFGYTIPVDGGRFQLRPGLHQHRHDRGR